MSKIILELSEQDIKIKLDDLIAERVSKITDAYISEKVSKIMDVKLERMDVHKIFEEQARKLLVEQYGEPTRYNSKWSKTINTLAIGMLNEQFAKTGASSS